jgi:hypothetical protein
MSGVVMGGAALGWHALKTIQNKRALQGVRYTIGIE